MTTPTLRTLGRKLREKRAGRGIRAVATEVGISPATLSRVERGYLPDLETFGKLCKWLGIDPGEVLRFKRPRAPSESASTAAVHFRKDHAVSASTASALANLILAAQRALLASEPQGE
jgi:transcriptional regulator with XRE-family HTH domain